MRTTVLAVLLAGCAIDPTEGIPGDTSPDNPSEPPDEGGKNDEEHGPVTYGGGVVMAAPVALNLYWGSYWATDAGVADRGAIDAMTTGLGAQPWWGLMGEYPDKHGHAIGALTFGDDVVASDSEPPAKIRKEGPLTTFLTAQLRAGAIAWDAQTIYTIFTPPGTVGPTDECGHHSYFTTTIDGKKRKVIYALIPYLDKDDAGCGVGVSANGVALDNITVTFSHELAEAATDPYLDAWGKGSDNEVADPCSTGAAVTMDARTFVVQDLWSNAANACISTP